MFYFTGMPIYGSSSWELEKSEIDTALSINQNDHISLETGSATYQLNSGIFITYFNIALVSLITFESRIAAFAMACQRKALFAKQLIP